MALGEGYMNGQFDIIDGDVRTLLDLGVKNYARRSAHAHHWPVWATRLINFFYQHNPRNRARRNVAHHYDLSEELYRLFLDADRQYSCAYFQTPDDDLETAQRQKKRHLAAKLLLQPGQKVLDIGCGWGGLGLYLSGHADVEVVGVTLSEEQHKVARARAEASGLAQRADFRLTDYRDLSERFDRIVSVGMFEHVGLKHYDEYFRKVYDLLTDDGVAVVHTIGRTDGPGVTNSWIRKYIFPGGYVPALSEMMPAIERAGLVVTDVEILRLHYAETLKHWYERFMEHRKEVLALYDERFCRMWEFYLAGCEASFRHWGQVVFQVQLARRQDAVPLTRDYITDTEREWAARERRHELHVAC
tara:strand:- start:19 stop:1095 length:1077 start_codon:yes stop_codon:yes gene_type:complete